MAKNKKSFVLYCDLIYTVEKLTDTQAGKLFKLILSYVDDRNPKTKDVLLQVAFEPIKRQLKRDLKRWEEEKDQRSLNGNLGNLKRWYPKLYKQVSQNKLSLEDAWEQSQRIAPRSTTIANIADNVTVTDSVNVTDKKIFTNVNSTKYGKNELNKLSEALKLKIQVQDFKESQKQQRIHLQNLYKLMIKISTSEFSRRLDLILEDSYKRGRCGSLYFVYQEIKGFVEPKSDMAFIS